MRKIVVWPVGSIEPLRFRGRRGDQLLALLGAALCAGARIWVQRDAECAGVAADGEAGLRAADLARGGDRAGAFAQGGFARALFPPLGVARAGAGGGARRRGERGNREGGSMNREAIYAALFALVSAAPGLVTVSRKLRHWSDVPQSERPALFQAQKSETPTQTTGRPASWLLAADLYIYVSTAGAASPGEVLNPILDHLAAQLDNRAAGVPQTLGGLVQWARIEGTIETSEGA